MKPAELSEAGSPLIANEVRLLLVRRLNKRPAIMDRNNSNASADSHVERGTPMFVVSSWLLPAVIWMATLAIVRSAQSVERRSGHFDGFGESITGMLLVSLAASICGFIAFRRREHLWPLALVPAVGSIGYFTSLLLA